MRKTLLALTTAALVAGIAAPASAQTWRPRTPIVAGAIVGTVVGVGLYNGWFGSGAFAASLPASAGGAATAGFVAGIGTIALWDAITNPCQGFSALLARPGCANGQPVVQRVAARRR